MQSLAFFRAMKPDLLLLSHSTGLGIWGTSPKHLHIVHHDVTNQRAANASSSCGKRDDLPIATIEAEGYPNTLTVGTTALKAIPDNNAGRSDRPQRRGRLFSRAASSSVVAAAAMSLRQPVIHPLGLSAEVPAAGDVGSASLITADSHKSASRLPSSEVA